MKSDELDEILDRGLKSYAEEELRPGLERRVLNRVWQARETRRIKWLQWAIGFPAFASVLILGIMFWPKRDANPQLPKLSVPLAKAAPALGSTPKSVGAVVRKPRRKGSPSPKCEKFPTPAPLTEEERVLLALVVRKPDAREVLAISEKHMSEPLEIAEIDIKPLQDGGEE